MVLRVKILSSIPFRRITYFSEVKEIGKKSNDHVYVQIIIYANLIILKPIFEVPTSLRHQCCIELFLI